MLVGTRSIGTGTPRRRIEPLPTIAAGPIQDTDPLPIACYVDGIQSARLLTMREGRPLYLVYVAAGALGAGSGALEDIVSAFRLLVSWRDEEFAAALPGGVPVLAVDDEETVDIDLTARSWIDTTRRAAEAAVTSEALHRAAAGTWVLLDGSLPAVPPSGAPDDLRLMSVVKTVTETQYLLDETTDLPTDEGHISPSFLLPGRRRGEIGRASTYLRQRFRPYEDWSFGLVRLELPAQHAGLLPCAAAAAFAGRQRVQGDSRWERQQAGVALLERSLRSVAPPLIR